MEGSLSCRLRRAALSKLLALASIDSRVSFLEVGATDEAQSQRGHGLGQAPACAVPGEVAEVQKVGTLRGPLGDGTLMNFELHSLLVS